MDVTTTPSLYGDRDVERGAGGKLRKAQARKRPATSYDRPPVNLASRGTGSWWSKLGDPAYRLVSGAAKMILPSFFTNSPALLPSTETETEDKLDLEVIPNAKGDDPCMSSYDTPKFTERSEPSEVALERLKTICESEGCGQDGPKNLNNDSQLSGIEQLIKGKIFSRDEINRLTEILNSRVGNLSDVDGEKKNEVTTTSRHTAGVKLTPFTRISDEGNQEELSRAILRTPKPHPHLYPNVNAQDDVGASPVDIAKAYMGSRMSELGSGSHNSLPKGEKSVQQNDEFVLKLFTPSYSRKSSTCWPGAMVQDPHGYISPSQRGRYGLHDFPRTPYSRTIYSKSRSKLTQLQADSSHQTTSSKAFPQLRTPIFGQVKSRNDLIDDSYGSVGPIRRIRNKFASEARIRGSILLNSSKDASSPFQQPSVSKGFPPMLEKNLEPGETSKHRPGDSGNRFEESVPLLNPSSSQAVKNILEQLDRNKPTPREKAAELKLATSWRKSPPEASHTTQKDNISLLDSGKFGPLKNTDSVEPKLFSEGDKNEGNSNSQVKFQKRSIEAEDAVVASSKSSGIDIGDSVTTNGVNAGTSFSQMKSFQREASVGIKNVTKEIGPNSSLHKQSNGQHVTSVSGESHFELSNKVIPHSSGTKPILPHISVGRRDPIRTVSSDNGAGFTFPVSSSSSVLSEPPTPSVMPFSVGSMVSHSNESTVPSYSFGTDKSAPRLVFSFPSTSSAPNHVDALDPKFNFGSDKKPRLSFGSVGKDAICY